MADDATERPSVVLDTNTLVQAIPSRGRFRPILEGFDAGRFLMVVSHEILLEYEEILRAIGGPSAWTAFESLLESRDEHVRRVEPTYFWQAIVHDPDDNKFVDAAVAGEAEWIVTEDGHYSVLEVDSRLTVRPILPARFIERYL